MVRLSGRHIAEVPVFAVLDTVNNDHQNLPELALIEGNQQIATKPDEAFSPSLFTFHSYFADHH